MAVVRRCTWSLAVGLAVLSCKKTSFTGSQSNEPDRKKDAGEKSPGELDASKGGKGDPSPNELDASKGGKQGDPAPNELDANGNPKNGDGTTRSPNGEIIPGNGTGNGGQNGAGGGTVPGGDETGTGGQNGTGGGAVPGGNSPGGEPFPTPTAGGTGGGGQDGGAQGPTGGVPGGTVDCGPRFQTIQTAGGPITVDTSYNPTTPVIITQNTPKDTVCTVWVREGVSLGGTSTTLVREGQGLRYSYQGNERPLQSANRYCAPGSRGLAVGIAEKVFALSSPVPAPGSQVPAPTQNGACVARKVEGGVPSADNTWFIVIP